MPKAVSSTEAKNKFATFLQWANQHNDGVVIEVRGKPKAALISYLDYEELLRLRKQEQKRKALAALDELRKELRQQNPELTTADAYRQAEFSPELIQAMTKPESPSVEENA